MSGVLNATVTSVDVGAGGVDELGTWLVMAATRVVRWAVLFARVGGIPLVSGGAGGRVDGFVVAQVVAVASRVSASVAAGLFCVELVRRVRQRGERSAGTAVAVYAGVVTGTAAAVAVAVGVADGLSEVALARGPGVADLAAIMDRGPVGAVDSPAGGSRAGAAALFLLWASAWIYMAELSWRLVIIVVSIAAIPLVAGAVLVPGRSWRWGRAVRWAVVAITIKPVLTLALVVEVAEAHGVGGLVGLVGGAAGLILLLSAPLTLFQFSALPARTTGRLPSLPMPVGPTAACPAATAERPAMPEAERPASVWGPGRPLTRVRRQLGERSARYAAAVPGSLAAMRRWIVGVGRGVGRGSGEAPRGRGAGVGITWPVVRELTVDVGPAPRSTRGTPQRREDGGAPSGRPVRRARSSGSVDSPSTVQTSPSPVNTSGTDRSIGRSSGAAAAEYTQPGGLSGEPAARADYRRGRTADGSAAVDRVDRVDRAVDRPSGRAARSRGDHAPGDDPRAVARTPWTLRMLGRPTLLAFRSDHTGTIETATIDIGTVDGGGAADVAEFADVGDAAVDLTLNLTPKMVELLAYLAVHPHGVRRDTIVAALWPDTARPRPANNLSALITRLRAALPTCSTGPAPAAQRPRSSRRIPAGTGGLVATAGDRYLLDPGQVSVDYWAFLAVTNGAATEQVGREPLDEGRLEALHTAHELYAGPLADGLDGEWVLSVREAARRSFLAATARLVRHHVQDAPTIALRLLEKARNLDPANEDLYRDIMALQLRAGDKHAAANTLRLLEAQLADIDEVLSGPVAELAKNIHLPDQE